MADIGATARGPEESRSSSTSPGGSHQGSELIKEGRHQRSQELPKPTAGRPDRHERRVPFALRRTGTTTPLTGGIGVASFIVF